MSQPAPPFAHWPIQRRTRFGFAWLTPYGPALITQATAAEVDVHVVDSMFNFTDKLATAQIQARLPNLVVLHDWRSIERVDAEAATHLLERHTSTHQAYAEYPTYVFLSSSPLVRMVVRTTSISYQSNAQQRSIYFEEDIVDTLAARHISPPPDDFLEKWLGLPMSNSIRPSRF